MNPSDESFWASKTMCLLCLGMAAILAMILLAVAVKVIWNVDTFQLVTTGVMGISAHSGAGTVRNVMTDTPQRQMLTQASVTPPLEPAPPIGADALAPVVEPAPGYAPPPPPG